jgi:hypothetical protein
VISRVIVQTPDQQTEHSYFYSRVEAIALDAMKKIFRLTVPLAYSNTPVRNAASDAVLCNMLLSLFRSFQEWQTPFAARHVKQHAVHDVKGVAKVRGRAGVQLAHVDAAHPEIDESQLSRSASQHPLNILDSNNTTFLSGSPSFARLNRIAVETRSLAHAGQRLRVFGRMSQAPSIIVR